MTILVSGSFVFDNIMNFHGRFSDSIMPDKVHMLNVSFETPELRREFGGCAGNIAYNIKLLGGECLPLATLGKDAEPYIAHLQEQKINLLGLQIVEDTHTAQAFIITDRDNNQITAFHPGAMNRADRFGVPEQDFKLAIVSPNSKAAMQRHSRELTQRSIPFMFDPGQAMGLFEGKELAEIINLATWLAVNDYEAQMISKKTGLSVEQMAENLDGLIITLGAKGSLVYRPGKVEKVEPVTPEKIVDPTGCGDAYRGALLHALAQGADLVEACREGSKMGALKIGVEGGQNHAAKFLSQGRLMP